MVGGTFLDVCVQRYESASMKWLPPGQRLPQPCTEKHSWKSLCAPPFPTVFRQYLQMLPLMLRVAAADPGNPGPQKRCIPCCGLCIKHPPRTAEGPPVSAGRIFGTCPRSSRYCARGELLPFLQCWPCIAAGTAVRASNGRARSPLASSRVSGWGLLRKARGRPAQ